MAKMTEFELEEIVSCMELDAVSNQDRFIAENEELLRRYKGDPYGNEVQGRSSVVSNDVQDVVESDMPSLVRVFLGSDSIMKFKPNNPENEKDVLEAEEKTAYVDWLIRGQDNSFRINYGFLKDVEIQKMGVLKYMFEETESTEEHEFKGVSELELQEIFASLEAGTGSRTVEVVHQDQQALDEFDIKFKVNVKRQEIKIIGVPTESFLISQNSSDLDDATLVGDKVSKTRGELMAEGFKRSVISDLPQISSDSSTMNNIRFEDEGGVDENEFREWSNQTVEISDLYVKIDFDGDGVAERRHIQKSGDVILVNEAFDHVPYAMASALLTSHKAIGEGRAEQVVKVAEVKTALTRQMLDNGYMVNNPKIGVNANVNLDDALSDKIGGVVRFKGESNPGQNSFPFVTPFIGDKSLLLIQHMDQIKASTVGNQMASQGLNADQIGKETATRFEGVEKSAKAKIELVARVVAEVGYRKLYSGIAWMVTRYQDTEREFSRLGKGLTVNPGNWKYDHQLSSEVGLGAGDNQEIVQNMTGLFQVQQTLKAQGSPLVDADKEYNTLKKLTKGLELKDVSLYFNNPNEPAELLKAENEILNKTLLQMQEQLQAMQNPLAEAETIKQQTELLKAQEKSKLDTANFFEEQRQFNIETAQKQDQFNKEIAAKLTKLEIDSGQNVPGSVV